MGTKRAEFNQSVRASAASCEEAVQSSTDELALEPSIVDAHDALPEAEPDGSVQPDPVLLDLILQRLTDIDARVAEFHQRAARREGVIDRLHAENQELRAGVRRAILEPAVTDLIRLYDALTNEAARADSQGGASPAMLSSFADDVELILDRCGVERFVAASGDPYRPGDHKPLAVVPTADPEGDKTVAEVTAAGFRDRETGRVRRPLQARFFQYLEPEDSDPLSEARTAEGSSGVSAAI